MTIEWVRIVPQGSALLRTTDVCRRSGVRYRRLHYWMVQGVFGPPVAPGSGQALEWSPEIIPLAVLLRRLSDALSGGIGVPTPLLRRIVLAWERGDHSIDLDAGGRLVLAWGNLMSPGVRH